ncbi:MAG: hypothetical protein MRY75_05865 [Marivita sp.]|uniref:hypothetical protein n=1 Tax=Marivita sp. TaxID=2003365 RepID=UPI0025B924D3|nr:hypothetical protein [Marivita sp.]MCI5110062.1 hypothetical protein [Marivita sp.]
MTYYIAELDEAQQVVAVWIKEDTARSPRVFDPRKHIFDTNGTAEFSGAPKEKIQNWIARAQADARANRLSSHH